MAYGAYMQSAAGLLQKISKVRKFVKGQAVFRQNDPAEAIYKVLQGEVQLYRHNERGGRVLLYRAYEDHYFAEASLNSDTYHCTAECVKTSEIQVINAGQMLEILNRNSQFALSWVLILSSELRRQRASVERLTIKSAAERIRHYILTEGDPWGALQLKGSLSDMADVLGLSRETLYRTLAKMEQAGEIERNEQGVQLT
jgi:CRP-like cAMP-binding protein